MEGSLTQTDFVKKLINELDETKKVFYRQLGKFITILSKTDRVSDMRVHGFKGGTSSKGSKLSTIMVFYNLKKKKGNSQPFGNLPM